MAKSSKLGDEPGSLRQDLIPQSSSLVQKEHWELSLKVLGQELDTAVF